MSFLYTWTSTTLEDNETGKFTCLRHDLWLSRNWRLCRERHFAKHLLIQCECEERPDSEREHSKERHAKLIRHSSSMGSLDSGRCDHHLLTCIKSVLGSIIFTVFCKNRRSRYMCRHLDDGKRCRDDDHASQRKKGDTDRIR